MSDRKISHELRLKKIVERRNYFTEEIKQKDSMSKKYKNFTQFKL